jgi:ribosome maturation protein SDO1
VNTTDGKQFPVSIILKAMAEANVKVNPKHDAKKQALEFIKELKKVIPIDRARMRLRVAVESEAQVEKLKEIITRDHAQDCEIERVTDKMMQL